MRKTRPEQLNLTKHAAIGLSIAWALAASASAALAAPAMPLGEAVPPPVGFLDYCNRSPIDCAPDGAGAASDAASIEKIRARVQAARTAALAAGGGRGRLLLLPPAAAAVPAAPEPPPPTIAEPAGLIASSVEPRELPSLVLARIPQPGDAILVAAARDNFKLDKVIPYNPPVTVMSLARAQEPPVAPVALTADLRAELKRVNNHVNRSLIRSSDAQAYGVEDYWATPIADGAQKPYGDCEDYVLEKRKALIAAGLPAHALSIAVVTTPWNESHAVLLVDTNEGELVLDNLSPWIVFWNQTAYRWEQREKHGDPFDWTTVAVVAAAGRPTLR